MMSRFDASLAEHAPIGAMARPRIAPAGKRRRDPPDGEMFHVGEASRDPCARMGVQGCLSYGRQSSNNVSSPISSGKGPGAGVAYRI